tara:strand:+ start:3372 stop:4064 length:693 start_codon:yes stop_codon:yes gene_type:complete
MDWKKEALEHARQQQPIEACGILAVVKGREKYFACRNIAEDPIEGFCIDPDDWVFAEEEGEPIAIVHSHPDCSTDPSPVDLASCEYIDLPFYICNPETEQWNYFEPSGYKAPLLGRKWTWKSADCWTLVIDYFAEKGLEVKNWERPKRSEEILTNGIFERLIPKSNFILVDDEIQVGDLLLHKFKGPCPDHVSVYIGDQKVIHHMYGRLSSRDLYGPYLIESTVRRYRHA